MRRSALALACITLNVALSCSNKGLVPPPPAPTGGAPGVQSTAPTGGVVSVQSCADAGGEITDSLPFVVGGCLHVGSTSTLAVFGWGNRTGETKTVAYGRQNQVQPGASAQGQPETFVLGAGAHFAVPFTGEAITWSILGQTVTVDVSSSDCEGCYGQQLVGIDGYTVDLCTESCGDGICNSAETCRSCPSDCDCSAITPLIDCVMPMNGLMIASFGYRNLASRGGRFDSPAENTLAPGEVIQGQTSLFQPGEVHHAFQVAFAGAKLTWTLGLQSVTATTASPGCTRNCEPCSGVAICVNDTCHQVCGDGQCSDHENCDLCPGDCGCGAIDQCMPGGGCFSPPQCGHDIQCGTYDTYGVHTDCGACPDGQRCVAHQCVGC